MLAEEHAIAEHVTAHVADARDGEVLRLGVDVHLAEVPLHGLPCAASGDAHGLVVVADRAAGREGIAQPEAVLLGDRVREIRERRRALVGGHHQVRVVAVMAHDIGGRNDDPVDEVVGDVEHGLDELAVGGLSRTQPRVPVDRWIGQPLGVEAALGADGDDDRVLDLLGLDQAEDLRAEVLLTIAPAKATAGDLAEAEVHALDHRREDPDLVLRPRQRQVRDGPRIQLEGDGRAVQPIVVDLEVVGAQRRTDHRQVGAQDPVLVEARHPVERLLDLGDETLLALVTPVHGSGCEPRLEQADEQARDRRVADDDVLEEALAERRADLPHVAGVRAKDECLTPPQPSRDDQ